MDNNTGAQIDVSKIEWDDQQTRPAVPQASHSAIDLSQVKWDDDLSTGQKNTVPSGVNVGVGGRLLKGMKDPLDAAAQLLTHALPGSVVGAVNNATQYVNEIPVVGDVTKALGMVPATEQQLDKGIAESEQQYQAARKDNGQFGMDLVRIGGNLAATVPIAFTAAPSAGLLAKAAYGAASGGTFGALQPVTQGDFVEEKKGQVVTGAALGGLMAPVAQVVSRVIQPNAASNKQVQTLLNEGVTPTPGQLLGGVAQRIEDKATSIPIVGDAITMARQRGLKEYNHAIINRTLEPIGGKVDEIGREGIAKAQELISKAYEDILPAIKFKADAVFGKEVANIKGMINHLPKDQIRKFDKIIEDRLVNKLTPQGAADGLNYKQIESEIGRLAKDYLSDAGADNRQLGAALSEVQKAVRANLARAYPQAASKLDKVNKAYANFTRLQRAAASAGAENGLFTPAQFSNAVRAGDTSMRKGSFAKGGAVMQDLADAGKTVLSSKVADSGTAGRMLGAGAGLSAGVINPAIPATLIGASLPYLPIANKLAASLIAKRPDIAKPVARAVSVAPGSLAAALLGGNN